MKKNIGILFFITAVALLLRLICIDKPDGLWNDEYVSWMISAVPFGDGFWNSVKLQCHMPLYYLYLKLVMAIFGQSDIVLRLSSLVPGILAVPVMFFVGNEKNENTGYLCATMTAISSFLIYYSQEVRLYSLLFLLSAFSLLYLLKSINNPNKKNFVIYAISNILILLTHTIGFVFVFFNLIVFSINLFNQYKKLIRNVWISIFAGGLIISPLAVKILTTQSFSQWWGHFSISKIGFLFTDYFSPILTNLTNAPDNLFYMPKFALYMFLPALIAILGICIAIIKDRLCLQLFTITLSTVTVMVIAAILGKLVFITKYSIEIYPILILLACYGITLINKKWLRNILVTIYCLLSLWYIIKAPNSAPKMRRIEGHKIVTDILEELELKKDDVILLEYYTQKRFDKYFDFSDYKVVSINKGNFPVFLSENHDYIDILKNGKELYKSMFYSSSNKYFENVLDKEIFNQLKPNQSVAVVTLNSVSGFSPAAISKITQSDDLYGKVPFLFLVFSYVKNESMYNMMKNLSITRIEQKGSWTVVKFTKLNNSILK